MRSNQGLCQEREAGSMAIFTRPVADGRPFIAQQSANQAFGAEHPVGDRGMHDQLASF